MRRLPTGPHGAARSPRPRGSGASGWSTGRESWVAFHGCSGSGRPKGGIRFCLTPTPSLAANIPEHREAERDHALEIGAVHRRHSKLTGQNVIDVVVEDGL